MYILSYIIDNLMFKIEIIYDIAKKFEN